MKSASRRFVAACAAATEGLFGALRLAAFVAAIAVASFAILLHTVRADINEAILGFGAEMMQFPGAQGEDPRDVHLNGARVELRSQTVNRPLPEVLAHYRHVCGRQSAKLFDQLGGLLGVGSRLPSGALASLATASASTEDSGYVACVDLASSPDDLGAFANRFLRFTRTEDLRELGGLRFAYVQRAEREPLKRSLLLTIWADSGPNLRRLLPRGTADADGRDPEGIPRAPGTQRILSAWEAERPSGVFIYQAEAQTSAELESFYRAALPDRGWKLIERNNGESVRIDGIRMLSARRAHRTVTVLAYPARNGRSTLTILSSEPS